MSKIFEAINKASIMHKDQYRKGGEVLHVFSHLCSVAFLLLEEGIKDDDIIVAALMHDSIEDIPNYTFTNLENDFGKRVMNIVQGVTEDNDLSYKDKKESYLENLKHSSVESLLVSLADKIHNSYSLIDMWKNKDTRDIGMSLFTLRQVTETRIDFHLGVLAVAKKFEKNYKKAPRVKKVLINRLEKEVRLLKKVFEKGD